MASTKQVFHRALTKGMNFHAASEAEKQGEPSVVWRLAKGMRFRKGAVRQFPRKKVWKKLFSKSAGESFDYTYPWRINLLTFLPAGGQVGAGVLVALTEGQAFRLTHLGEFMEIPQEKKGFLGPDFWVTNYGGWASRWGACVYNGKLYFTREGAPISETDGWYVKVLNPDVYGAFVEVFYDHLVVANGFRRGFGGPNYVFWSDLRNFGNFKASTTSEADYYRIEEHQRLWSPIRGITGMARMGEALLVYTPEAIYGFQYVGLPKVFQESHVILDHGCGFPHGLVPVHNTHYFPSFVERTFFVLDGQEVVDIGPPIAEYFYSGVRDVKSVWGFYDPRQREVWWVYGRREYDYGYQEAVVFNVDEKTWSVTPVEDISAFCCAGVIPEQIDSDIEIDLDNAPFDEPGGVLPLPEAVFGRAYGSLLVEEKEEDSIDSLLYVPDPTLTSPYFLYNEGQSVKEVDSVTIHAGYQTAKGLQVLLSRKNNLSVDAPYVDVGVPAEPYWLPSTPEGRYSFPRTSGRAFSFRFRFVGDLPPPDIQKAEKFVFGVELPGVENFFPEEEGKIVIVRPPLSEPIIPTPCVDVHGFGLIEVTKGNNWIRRTYGADLPYELRPDSPTRVFAETYGTGTSSPPRLSGAVWFELVSDTIWPLTQKQRPVIHGTVEHGRFEGEGNNRHFVPDTEVPYLRTLEPVEMPLAAIKDMRPFYGFVFLNFERSFVFSGTISVYDACGNLKTYSFAHEFILEPELSVITVAPWGIRLFDISAGPDPNAYDFGIPTSLYHLLARSNSAYLNLVNSIPSAIASGGSSYWGDICKLFEGTVEQRFAPYLNESAYDWFNAWKTYVKKWAEKNPTHLTDYLRDVLRVKGDPDWQKAKAVRLTIPNEQSPAQCLGYAMKDEGEFWMSMYYPYDYLLDALKYIKGTQSVAGNGTLDGDVMPLEAAQLQGPVSWNVFLWTHNPDIEDSFYTYLNGFGGVYDPVLVMRQSSYCDIYGFWVPVDGEGWGETLALIDFYVLKQAPSPGDLYYPIASVYYSNWQSDAVMLQVKIDYTYEEEGGGS